MRKFRVISSTLSTPVSGAKQSRSKGDIITDRDIPHRNIDTLIRRGFIEEIEVFQQPITGKIKLAIVTSVWKRPEVFQMFCIGVSRLLDKCPDFEIHLIVSGSERRVSEKVVEMCAELLMDQHGLASYQYIEIPNEPLAAKVNSTTYACRNLGVHYVLCMGSDDIISPELLNEYGKHMRQGIDFIGVTDFYFYDTVSKRSLYWAGYLELNRKGHTAGAARALSARLLSKWDWMPWENKDSLMLDKSMQDKLKVTPHSIHTFSMRELGLYAVDIKSSTNMTPFKQWDNSEFIPNDELKKLFPYVIK